MFGVQGFRLWVAGLGVWAPGGGSGLGLGFRFRDLGI